MVYTRSHRRRDGVIPTQLTVAVAVVLYLVSRRSREFGEQKYLQPLQQQYQDVGSFYYFKYFYSF